MAINQKDALSNRLQEFLLLNILLPKVVLYIVHKGERQEKMRSTGLGVHLEEKMFALLTLWAVVCVILNVRVILNGYLQRTRIISGVLYNPTNQFI